MSTETTQTTTDHDPESPLPPQGSLLFTWVCAATATWFLLPARTITVALAAALLGGLAVVFTQLFIRNERRLILRDLAIAACCFLFGVVPSLRSVMAHGSEAGDAVRASYYLVGTGLLLLISDILARRRSSGTRWLQTLGIITVVVAAAIPLWLSRSAAEPFDNSLLAHTVIAPCVALGCWLASLRWPRLDWLLGAVLFGATVPALTIMKVDSFAAMGGLGFVLYVALQVLVVFAARRFLLARPSTSAAE